MRLMNLLGTRLFDELNGAYSPVLAAIMQLESDYPLVARNQIDLSDIDADVTMNALANLLYASQGSVVKEQQQSRRQVRDAIVTLQHIPGVRVVFSTLVMEFFSATIFMLEHLFFLNREIERRVKGDLPSDMLQGRTREQLVYPMDRVEDILAQAYQVWREQHVLQNAAKE
jgi:hypothetical protein